MSHVFTLEDQCFLVPCGTHDGLGSIMVFKTEAAARAHVDAIPRREYMEGGALVGWSKLDLLDIAPDHPAMSAGRLYGQPGAEVLAIWGRLSYEADGTPYDDGLGGEYIDAQGYMRLVRTPIQ